MARIDPSRLQPGRALIVHAGLPPLNMTARHFGDWVIAVADLGSGPTVIRSVVDLDRDRWLLPGMTVSIGFDPARAGEVHWFTVDWESVPTVRDLVAANDPVVTDPRAARTAVLQTQAAAARPAPAPRGFFGGTYTISPCSGPSMNLRPWTIPCDEAIARAASTPAPTGQVRAVAIIAAMRMMFVGVGHDMFGRPVTESGQHGSYTRSRHGNETVFAVNVPGRSPYAVFVPEFQAPKKKPATTAPATYPWLPALVSTSDPNAVEIAWDDVSEWEGQVGNLITGSYQSQMAALGDQRQQFQGQLDAALAAYGTTTAALTQPPAAASPAAASSSAVAPAQSSGPVTLPPEAHQQAAMLAAQIRMVPAAMQPMVVGQSRMGLDALPPEMREAYLALWRAYGIPV